MVNIKRPPLGASSSLPAILLALVLLVLGPATRALTAPDSTTTSAALSSLDRRAEGSPQASQTQFDNLPARIFYFEDTTIVFYHDLVTHNVWRSKDEGKTWALIPDVPANAALMVLEHPYDNKIAFVMGSGTTHWRTLDRGESWASFEVPVQPAFGMNALGWHSKKWNWIIYTGIRCEKVEGWAGQICSEETYYTQDAFATAAKPLAKKVSHCMFAHEKKQYSSAVPDEQVYCVAWQAPGPDRGAGSGGDSQREDKEFRLYSSRDFFASESSFVDLGIGKDARGVVGIGGVTKFLVAALKPNANSGGEMLMYVTQDGQHWNRALFPHGHGLKENAYTIVESTDHSILVDVNTNFGTGTLFTSNSDGTNFVRSLEHTNRNQFGLVDFERVVGLEGVGVINTVSNAEDAARGAEKQLKTRITFDDGAHWQLLAPPKTNVNGQPFGCDSADRESCSLHLHSVTQPHNYGRVFSSTVPGFIMGVGSVGSRLLSYEESDTFLSTDGGITWKMVGLGAHKYEFGGEGSLLVIVDDEVETRVVKYSFDFGESWKEFDMGVTVRARLLTTINDSTGLKFFLLGTLARTEQSAKRHTVVFLDFLPVNKRKCTDSDREKWYARKIDGVEDCLMGHKQYYMRRKPSADCVVQTKFKDPVANYENCACADEDYECDFNFARGPDGHCTQVGPEPIPSGQCTTEGATFMGSSGYRLIPGDTCDPSRGISKDKKLSKPCSAGQATPGLVSHQVSTIPGMVLDQAYLSERTLIAFTSQNKVWQSPNEGYSWNEVAVGSPVVSMIIHAYYKDRAYLVTQGRTVHFTTNKGASWSTLTAPSDPNALGIPVLDFHPTRPDRLIWTGQDGCAGEDQSKCHAVAHYSQDHGRSWKKIDDYVRVCTWARDSRFKLDEKLIFCESFKTKQGNQRTAFATGNQLQLVAGNFYQNRETLFENIVGFATFEEYMVVAEVSAEQHGIALKVSLDGKTFAQARFPPGMQLLNQAYTVLESVTDSVFLHVTTHAEAGSEWGALFKSNSNGTYYSLSLDHVNRNSLGFVDFEKMLGLDGIALINTVANPDEASQSGQKKLQTRITHNDGGYWKPLVPPKLDSLGQAYPCTGTKCALHVHGYTERRDPRATYSSPSAVGLMIAVGNVGETLAPYTESDTFLTRDGGFTWEEIHKDAHVWEFGDQGSILVLANDEDSTDHVSYSLDEGLSWQDYNFGTRIRVSSINTVPMDTSRKFVVFGIAPGSQGETVAVHLDFSSVTNVKCSLNIANPDSDDFELWSPSEEREEQCLFGEQVFYHRRIRDRNCYVGEKLPEGKQEKLCGCSQEDFECEFNYQRNQLGQCVLVPGAQPLGNEDQQELQCKLGQEFWFERTSMRRVPHSKCQGGLTLDQGTRHACPGPGAKGFFFWASVSIAPFFIAGLAAVWWTRRRGGGGRIRLPEPGEGAAGGLVDLALSVPWFVLGVAGVAFEKARELESKLPASLTRLWRGRGAGQRGGYRSLHVDDDAELLNDYDEED